MLENAKMWSANQRKVQEWLALPTILRVPHTQVLLAQDLGVSEQTISRWRALPGFMEEVQAIIRRNLSDNVHDAVGALKRRANAGEAAQLKMYLEMIGWYTPGMQIKGDPDSPVIVKILRGVSTDDL